MKTWRIFEGRSREALGWVGLGWVGNIEIGKLLFDYGCPHWGSIMSTGCGKKILQKSSMRELLLDAPLEVSLKMGGGFHWMLLGGFIEDGWGAFC